MKKPSLAGKLGWSCAVIGLLIAGQFAAPAEARAADFAVIGPGATLLTDSQNNSQGGRSMGAYFWTFWDALFH